VAFILNHSEARFLFYGAAFDELIGAIRPRLQFVERFVRVRTGAGSASLDYEDLLSESGTGEPEAEVSGNDVCQLMYTSGTTGRPKGALITHQNVVWNLFNTILGRDEKEGETSVVVGPLFHTAPLNNHFSIRVAMAGTTIFLNTFEPRRLMEIIQEERVTVISGPPTMFHLLFALPDLARYDTGSVTKCTTGASILPEHTKRRILEVFPNVEGVYDIYGCTEASPSVTTLKGKDSIRKQECVGLPLPFVQVRIVDDDDRDVPCGKVGELICRGPNVMKGYYKDETGTREALKGGWLHTGDLARMDQEGFLYIVDRKKDMIITGGENVYPREIEEVLFLHPKIQEAAVIGIPDPVWGESVKAVVVLKEGEAMKQEEVIEYCKIHLASYKKPKFVEFAEKLPKGASGKVLKNLLKGSC
jgi:acyl-CoA synthetase (AMP-forming)/AMP-acid ligase II